MRIFEKDDPIRKVRTSMRIFEKDDLNRNSIRITTGVIIILSEETIRSVRRGTTLRICYYFKEQL
jgi:hypothetical protein